MSCARKRFWNSWQDVLTEAVALLAMWLDPALRLSRVALPQWVLLAVAIYVEACAVLPQRALQVAPRALERVVAVD